MSSAAPGARRPTSVPRMGHHRGHARRVPEQPRRTVRAALHPAPGGTGPGPPVQRRRARGALAGTVLLGPDVAARLGPRRAGPQRLRLQRQRDHGDPHLGPVDRRATAGDGPAQRHPRRRPAAGRRDGLVVRRHRRRRVRPLGERAVRRRLRARTRRARRPGRLPGRAGDRAPARRARHVHRRRHDDLAARPRLGRPGPRSVPAHRGRRGGRAQRGRDAAGDPPLRARRLPAPRGARPGHGRRRGGRRAVRRPREGARAAGVLPGRRRPAAADRARAPRPRGGARLGPGLRCRDRVAPRPAG